MTPLEQELKQVESLLSKIQSEPTLQLPLLCYGYSMEQLYQGLALYERVRALIGERSAVQKAKLAASQEFRQVRYKAQRRYNLDLGMAQLALSDFEEWRMLLKANGKHKHAADNWQKDAEQFYLLLQNAPTIHEFLEPYGLTTERIAESLNLLQQVEEARSYHYQQTHEANHSTRDRDAALKTLRNWLALFKVSLRLALGNDPDLLTSLGVESRRHTD